MQTLFHELPIGARFKFPPVLGLEYRKLTMGGEVLGPDGKQDWFASHNHVEPIDDGPAKAPMAKSKE